MMDDYEIDGHKLDLHPERVADWIGGKTFYPIYVEMSPSGTCNHHCSFCGLDFMVGQRTRFLDTDLLRKRLPEMAGLGVRAIQYAGEGEPLLHGDISNIVQHTFAAGIDVGISTNGFLLNASLAKSILPYCTWIKISVDAGTRETHARVHGCKESDFGRVMANARNAVEVREANGYECTLGFQMVVLPENYSEVRRLAVGAFGVGMDYVVFKPYSRQPLTKSEKYRDVSLPESWSKEVRQLETGERFRVIVREEAFRKSTGSRRYDRCLALPFWAYVDAGGGVWGCYRFLGDERFYYGNLCENTFEEIWQGDLRKRSLEMMENFDISQCGVNCRMDRINEYLWELKHPGRHVNFI
jgi:MoaA/NifB/PqqE/SkfB family radical SAM enzyme